MLSFHGPKQGMKEAVAGRPWRMPFIGSSSRHECSYSTLVWFISGVTPHVRHDNFFLTYGEYLTTGGSVGHNLGVFFLESPDS